MANETKSHKYTKAERDAAIAQARETKQPVLLAEWFEGWKGHESHVKLFAMPDGGLQEKATKATK